MKAVFALLLFSCWSVTAKHSLSPAYVERLADAIYVIEGGAKAQVPYGILSMPVKNEKHARQVCITTIRNTHARWITNGAKGHFLDFLADRYCPPNDSVGNANWKKNIRRVLVHQSAKTKSKTPQQNVSMAAR